MFSGIISECGSITHIKKHKKGISVLIKIPSHLINHLKVGASIAINGVCSTVVSIKDSCVEIDYLPETLAKTNLNNLSILQEVNIELSLKLSDFVSGHLVSGHIDETGKIISYTKDLQWHILKVEFSNKYAQYIVKKGWIVINGIALTIVDVFSNSFTCHIIPHTHNVTILSKCKVGDKVNLEFDMIAKYVEQILKINNKV